MKGRSCLSQILVSYNEIYTALDRKSSIDIIYLDFQKAFDKVPQQELMLKLWWNGGITGLHWGWFRENRSNRLHYVEVSGVTSRLQHPVLKWVVSHQDFYVQHPVLKWVVSHQDFNILCWSGWCHIKTSMGNIRCWRWWYIKNSMHPVLKLVVSHQDFYVQHPVCLRECLLGPLFFLCT